MKRNSKGGQCTHEGLNERHIFARCERRATHRVVCGLVRSKWLCDVHAIRMSRNEVNKDIKNAGERNERGE